MNRQRLIPTWCVPLVVVMVGMAQMTLVLGADAPALTAQGEKIAAEYTRMQADLKEAITRLEPKVDEKKKAEFTKQFGALENVTPVTKA